MFSMFERFQFLAASSRRFAMAALMLVTVLVLPSSAYAQAPSEVASHWTGLSVSTIADVTMLILVLGPILGNLLAHGLTKLGYLKAAALVARWSPFATQAASAALRAPTRTQAIRAVLIEAKKEPELAPISQAAELLRGEPQRGDEPPIIAAVEPPKTPTVPPGVSVLLLVFAVSLLGCVDYVKAGALVANRVDVVADEIAPKLDAKCTQPMVAAATILDVLKRQTEVKSIASKCDKVMLAYDALRKSHIILRQVLLAASDGGITVGELIDATETASRELAAFVKVAAELDK